MAPFLYIFILAALTLNVWNATKMNVRTIFFNTTCQSCSLAKWAKFPFSSSALKIDAPLDLIHIVTFRDPLAFPRAGYIQVFYYLH